MHDEVTGATTVGSCGAGTVTVHSEPRMTESPHSPSLTRALLSRWHDGDRKGLEDLLDRDREFVVGYVRQRAGPKLLRKAELDDYVQEAMVQALQYCPRFLISDRDQFRGLLARITENILRDHAVSHRRLRRDTERERSVPTDSVLQLDPPQASVTRPSEAAQRQDDKGWIRLGLELLPRDDRQIVRLREWEGLSFAEVGEALGIATDAARMRFQRVLPKLAKLVRELRAGRLESVLDRTDRDSASSRVGDDEQDD